MGVLRLAIVGCGDWSGKMHLPALRNLAKVQNAVCVGVCDLNRTKADGYAGQLPGKPSVCTDVDEMLVTLRPDGVLILVPPPVAASVIERVARHRVPLLTEKPPAPDTATHRRLIEQIGDLPHVVAYNRRHSPYVQQARDWMRNQPIQSVTVLFSRHHRREPDFTTTAVHAIDTAWYLAGGDFAAMRIEAAPAGRAVSYVILNTAYANFRHDFMTWAAEAYVVKSSDLGELLGHVADACRKRGIEPPAGPQ